MIGDARNVTTASILRVVKRDKDTWFICISERMGKQRGKEKKKVSKEKREGI